MFCKNCGTQISDNAAFCHNCGTAISEPAPKVPQENQNAQSVPPIASSQSQSAYTPPAAPSASSNNNPYTYTAPNIYTVPPYQPATPPRQDNSKNGFAISSLILGIFGLLPCGINIVPAILALIFGILGKKSGRSGMATAGLVLAIVGLSLTALIFILGIAEGEFSLYDEGYYGDFSDYGMYF